MLLIENNSLDPYFNIATEEYLLKTYNEDIAMIWRSNPSVIVGKHQNTLAEINLDFIRKKQIPVVRRLSGGGTVFHDPGNVNFTFIFHQEKEKLVDFAAYTKPVIAFLKTLGVNARFEGKNDLRVDGLKISGNAEHVHRHKVLHHGTLLFNSNLHHLQEAIRAKEENFVSKAVKSNRSEVQNVTAFLQNKITCDEFTGLFRNYLIDYFQGTTTYSLNGADKTKIHSLCVEKYHTWNWNYGYSPNYVLSNQGMLGDESIIVKLEVARGKIYKVINFSIGHEDLACQFDALLAGSDHEPGALENKLKEVNFLGISAMENPWEMVKLFF